MFTAHHCPIYVRFTSITVGPALRVPLGRQRWDRPELLCLTTRRVVRPEPPWTLHPLLPTLHLPPSPHGAFLPPILRGSPSPLHGRGARETSCLQPLGVAVGPRNSCQGCSQTENIRIVFSKTASLGNDHLFNKNAFS